MANRQFINRSTVFDDTAARQHLQKAWWTAFLFCLILIMVGLSGLASVWQPSVVLRWLLQAAAVNAYVLWLLWKALKQNDPPPTKTLHAVLGYANWLTMLRGFLVGALAGFLFQTSAMTAGQSSWLTWLPGAIYVLAAVLDYVDGYVARITGQESPLGEWLDTKIDALGLLIAPLVAIGYGRLPIFYAAVGFVYYVFHFGIWYREKTGRPVTRLNPHPAKRMIAGFQMGLVALALLPVFSRPATTITALIFMTPLMVGFFRDWLIVCGYAESNELQQTRWDASIDWLTTKLLPIFLRFVIAFAGIFLFFDAITARITGREAVSGLWLYLTQTYDLFEVLILTAAALMIAFGFITRIGALLLSIILASIMTTWNSPPTLFLLFSCAVTLMLTGSGLLSTWHPEDALLLEKLG